MSRERATSDEPAIGTRHPTILLAEDDAAFRSLLADFLRDDGYEVVEARNGGELLDYITFSLSHPAVCARADLLITDLHMPSVDGLDAMASLRHARCLPKTIVMTGIGSLEEREQARALGAVVVLEKPFSLDDLHDSVADCFKRQVA
jgi:CheY-like chemotaxis protein